MHEKNMGYFFVKVKEPLQFMCNEEREGKIRQTFFFFK